MTVMTGSLKDQTVLVIGRGSVIARAITVAARDAGARVIAAGRRQEGLSAAYAGEPGIAIEAVDLNDEASIGGLGERLGSVDHVVSTASARARGRIADLDRDAIMRDARFPAPAPAQPGGRPSRGPLLPDSFSILVVGK